MPFENFLEIENIGHEPDLITPPATIEQKPKRKKTVKVGGNEMIEPRPQTPGPARKSKPANSDDIPKLIMQAYQTAGWTATKLTKNINDFVAQKTGNTLRDSKYHFVHMADPNFSDEAKSAFIQNAKVNQATPVLVSVDAKQKISYKNAETGARIIV